MKFPIYYLLLAVCLILSCTQEKEANSTTAQKGGKAGFSRLSASQTGVNFKNTITETRTLNYFTWDALYMGAGVAVGDINNDGLSDLIFTASLGPDQLYLNKGNFKFENITAKSGLVHKNNVSGGVNFIDINNDGWLDIYINKFGFHLDPNQRANELYINNGDLSFTESANQYGLADKGYSIQSSFFDYDKDGDLDMYQVNQPSAVRSEKRKYNFETGAGQDAYTSDKLYRNNGNNSFTDVTEQAGVRNFAYGLGLVISDVNNDGWSDIYVATDYKMPDNLFINQKDGTFKDKVGESFNHMSNFGMGADISDINNDGLMDIAALDMAGANHVRSKTNMPSMRPDVFWKNVNNGLGYQYMHNTLQLNNGDDTFSEIGYMANIAKTDWSWSLLLADFDNDSYDDMFITNGIKKDVRNNDFTLKMKQDIAASKGNMNKDIMEVMKLVPSVPMPNYMYRNTGKLNFEDVSKKWGIADPGFSNGAAYADLDNDGDLDLIINNVDEEAGIYKNNGGGNHLRIQLLPGKNKRPVLNSKVKLYADNQCFTKELVHSRGYYSMSENILHFGLGAHEKVDSLVVIWTDNNISVHKDVKINQLLSLDQSQIKKTRRFVPAVNKQQLFGETQIAYTHKENEYDDFSHQVLMPYKLSDLGPFISGQFSKSSQAALANDQPYEDMSSVFFDADGDKDLDLFVVSGGGQVKDNQLQDRLYINDGKGAFSKSNNIPNMSNNGLQVLADDFDQDGDQDLVVFGRVMAGKYPNTPPSYVLENNNGKFTLSKNILNEYLTEFGMVTDAKLVDIDGDKDLDIIAVGEWMHPRILINNDGKYQDQSKAYSTDKFNGLWFSVTAGDLDNDGDQDLILGNIGKNIKYKASPEKPFKLYANDFDKNGADDIVLTGYHDGKEVPVRGRECSSEQLPEIVDKFPTYQAFADASISEIYDLSSAKAFTAEYLESMVLINDGGKFSSIKLPPKAQSAPINGAEIVDVNNDGHQDIVAVGNLYSTEVETTRLDAGKGIILLGDSTGSFSLMPAKESGFLANKNAKDLEVIQAGQKKIFLVANNNDLMDAFILN